MASRDLWSRSPRAFTSLVHCAAPRWWGSCTNPRLTGRGPGARHISLVRLGPSCRSGLVLRGRGYVPSPAATPPPLPPGGGRACVCCLCRHSLPFRSLTRGYREGEIFATFLNGEIFPAKFSPDEIFPSPVGRYWKVRGRGAVWEPTVCVQKWPDQIFPTVNFVFSHDGHFGGWGGCTPPPPVAVLILAWGGYPGDSAISVSTIPSSQRLGLGDILSFTTGKVRRA